MHTLASTSNMFPATNKYSAWPSVQKATQRQRTFKNARDLLRSIRIFLPKLYITSQLKHRFEYTNTIFRCCHHTQSPSLVVKVDFAMVGIVSKCSPSLFSLLDKNIAIVTSCDPTSNIPCNARKGKATNYAGRQNKGTIMSWYFSQQLSSILRAQSGKA